MMFIGIDASTGAARSAATAAATRTAVSPDRKSAKPNGLVRLAWIAWAGDAPIDTANASPDDACAAASPPCACLSNMITSAGSKSACSDCSAIRLVQAKASGTGLKKPKASGPRCSPTSTPVWDAVCSNRLWSAPLGRHRRTPRARC